MRQYQYQPEGSAYRLELCEVPVPPLGPHTLHVRLRAASLNYRDLINCRKQAGREVAGIVPLSDGAGEVIAVGNEVTEWKPGDRVAGCFFPNWQSGRFEMRHHREDLGGSAPGVLSEIVAFPETGVVRVPDCLDYLEAATLPCAAVTAWTALTSRGNFQAGESLLVLGTGGVSIFGLQFARALGGRVIVTSSHDEKLERARQLGAEHLVNYRTDPRWDQTVWQWTGKRGVDHILEVGGGGTLEKSMQCIAASGHIALIGVLTGFNAVPPSLFPLLARNVTMNGIYVGSRADFQSMNAFIQHHQIHPIIDRVFDFREAPAAFQYLAEGSHFGKVVIAGPAEA